jgi:hypothetical protein
VKIYKNVPAVIAMGLAIFAAFGLAVVLGSFAPLLDWANSSDNPSGLGTWFVIIWSIVAPLLAIFAAISPALKVKPQLTLLLVAATLTIVLLLEPLTSLFWSIQAQRPIGLETLRQAFFPGFDQSVNIGRSLATVFGILGAISLAIAFTVKPKASPSPESFAQVPSNQAIPGAASPSQNFSQSGQVPSAYPTLTLVLAFFSPVIAVILGHVTLNHMRRGLISSANISNAKAGLIVGYVFIGLGFIVFIGWVIFLTAYMAGGF